MLFFLKMWMNVWICFVLMVEFVLIMLVYLFVIVLMDGKEMSVLKVSIVIKYIELCFIVNNECFKYIVKLFYELILWLILIIMLK